MLIRRLNNVGIDEFRKQLGELKIGERQNLEGALLDDSKYSTILASDIEIQLHDFKTKEEISRFLFEKLSLNTNRAFYYDVGLWSWLSLFYFDLVCPPKPDGSRSVKAEARYILADPKNWKRYYRHLLACPARLYTELGDLATPFLSAPIEIWGDFHEQLTAYQNIATNKALIGTAFKLYWDTQNLKLKRGAGSKGAGTPRRFSDIVAQFEMTYDLNAMKSEDILKLFPQGEFGKWGISLQ